MKATVLWSNLWADDGLGWADREWWCRGLRDGWNQRTLSCFGGVWGCSESIEGDAGQRTIACTPFLIL